MSFQALYTNHERRLGRFFEGYGRLVCCFPWCVLMCSVLINLVLGIVGFQLLIMEDDVEKLYTPLGNRAFKDRDDLNRLFPDDTNGHFYVKYTNYDYFTAIIYKTKDGSNILDSNYMNKIRKINEHIKQNIVIKIEDRILNFGDICATNKKSCVVVGEEVLDEMFLQMVKDGSVTYPTFMDFPLSPFLGGVTTDDNSAIKHARTIRMKYFLRQDEEKYLKLSRIWEMAFLQEMQQIKDTLLNKDGIEINFVMSKSINTEMNQNISNDMIYFVITILLMIIYATVATIGGDCVSSRQTLGYCGVASTLLAIFGAIGFVCLIGIKFVNIVSALPFLVLGMYFNSPKV